MGPKLVKKFSQKKRLGATFLTLEFLMDTAMIRHKDWAPKFIKKNMIGRHNLFSQNNHIWAHYFPIETSFPMKCSRLGARIYPLKKKVDWGTLKIKIKKKKQNWAPYTRWLMPKSIILKCARLGAKIFNWNIYGLIANFGSHNIFWLEFIQLKDTRRLGAR